MTLDIKQRYTVAVSTDRVGVWAKTKQLSFMITMTGDWVVRALLRALKARQRPVFLQFITN